MQRLLYCLLALSLLISPLVALDKPADMTTMEIISELKNNSTISEQLSEGLHQDSIVWGLKHEGLETTLGLVETKLGTSLVKIDDLETQAWSLESSLIVAEDFSKNLNEENSQKQKQIKALWITVGVLVAATVTSSLVAIFK